MVQDLCVLYVYQDLDFDLSRQHYSWIFNSRMTYESILILGKWTRFQIPGTALTFFSFTLFHPYGLGTQVQSPMPSFYFYLNFSLRFSLNGTKRMWDWTPTIPFTSYSLLAKTLPLKSATFQLIWTSHLHQETHNHQENMFQPYFFTSKQNKPMIQWELMIGICNREQSYFTE